MSMNRSEILLDTLSIRYKNEKGTFIKVKNLPNNSLQRTQQTAPLSSGVGVSSQTRRNPFFIKEVSVRHSSLVDK